MWAASSIRAMPENEIPPAKPVDHYCRAGAARAGAKRPFVYAALPRRRRFFRCLSNQKNLRNGSPPDSLKIDIYEIDIVVCCMACCAIY